MELAEKHIGTVETKTDLIAISPGHEAIAQLTEVFGEHTYFVNAKGLYVFRNDSLLNGGEPRARLFACGAWADEDRDRLLAFEEPVPTEVTIGLVSAELIGADPSKSIEM